MDVMFDHVYTDQHPVIDAQKKWLQEYEASFGGDPA
jgi:pyruvate dehydrogenase E1 component alpha subunit